MIHFWKHKQTHHPLGGPRNPLPLTLRWGQLNDLPDILTIENEAFPTPWRAREFRYYLAEPNTLLIIAEHANQIVGYVAYQAIPRRMSLDNLAVHADWRRHKVATRLIESLKNKLKRPIVTIGTEVRERNLPTQILLRSCRFQCTETIRGVYDDTNEDSYIFEYDLIPTPDWTKNRLARFFDR